MRTTAVVFPFDSFGNAGTGAGAQLLGDALYEVLEDNDLEERPTRCDSYRGKVEFVELDFPTPESIVDWKKTGRTAIRDLLKSKHFGLWFAGNHLGALPVYEELGNRGDVAIIQFDGHLDIHQFHDVTETPSNGNFLLHSEEQLPPIMNLGHRDLFLNADEIEQTFTAAINAEEIAESLTKVASKVRSFAKSAKSVWIDLDVDVFDPAFAPAVHQPQPFGLTPQQVLVLLNAAWAGNVIGVSVSEYDPGRDVRDTTLNLLGWLTEWVLLKVNER